MSGPRRLLAWIATALALVLFLGAPAASAAMVGRMAADPLADMEVCASHAGADRAGAGHLPGRDRHDACAACLTCCAVSAVALADAPPLPPAPAFVRLARAARPTPVLPRGPPARRARARDPPLPV